MNREQKCQMTNDLRASLIALQEQQKKLKSDFDQTTNNIELRVM